MLQFGFKKIRRQSQEQQYDFGYLGRGRQAKKHYREIKMCAAKFERQRLVNVSELAPGQRLPYLLQLQEREEREL